MSTVPEKPKKPITTYMVFRNKWMAKRKENSESTDKEELAEAWANIDEEEKNKLQADYDKENAAFKVKLAEWNEKYGEKKIGDDIPPKPKKPQNFYFYFRQQYTEKCKEKGEKIDKDELQDEYKKCTEEEKEKYAEEQKPLLEKWKKEQEAWEDEYGELYKKAQEQKKKMQENKTKKKGKKAKNEDSSDEDDEEDEEEEKPTKKPKKSANKKKQK